MHRPNAKLKLGIALAIILLAGFFVLYVKVSAPEDIRANIEEIKNY
ncbi:MAG: hypothetical protein KBC62_04865 [Candidatus Pacebacteria bacterium]|nr:hypothetical protein [Candidatus Paceibacterota bacterium]